MLVSSARITGVEDQFNIFGRSFIYKRNNKGPNIDPSFWTSDSLEGHENPIYGGYLFYGIPLLSELAAVDDGEYREPHTVLVTCRRYRWLLPSRARWTYIGPLSESSFNLLN
jgi:hypothetical protein